MQLLDGKALSQSIQLELKAEVELLLAQGGRAPHLVAVLVGEHPASASYVRNKMRACERANFRSSLKQLAADISQEELLAEIAALNQDPEVDGYILQLPLPAHIDEHLVTQAVAPEKDVDGFHPYNLGQMLLGEDCYLPATPMGMITLLERYGIETAGKEAVVIGRSNIVGRPMSVLLSRKHPQGDCTVTLLHSRSQNMAEHCRRADIIVAAIGRANFLTADMVKEGAIILDVGINAVDDSKAKRGYRLVGDVDFDALKDKVSAMTPVPGGVGPMTVVSLLMNCLKAYKTGAGKALENQ